jgi:RNA recognition motif-containing protein
VHKKTVFVGNLPFKASERQIHEVFAEHGAIEYVRLVRDKVTSLGRGYAYVCFEKRESAQIVSKLENVKVGERVVRIERCMKPQDKKKVAERKAAQMKKSGDDPKAYQKRYAPERMKKNAMGKKNIGKKPVTKKHMNKPRGSKPIHRPRK